MKVGTVIELARYPVKSVQGERLARAQVASGGIAGDRAVALVDVETGKVASAKLPHRWRKLLDFSAACTNEDGSEIRVTSPSGETLDVASAAFEATMSAALGRAVKLAVTRSAGLSIDRADPDKLADAASDPGDDKAIIEIGAAAPEGGFFDLCPIHLVATPSLDRVAQFTGSAGAQAARFRPNIVIDCPDARPFVENDWVGGVITIGAVELEVVFPTPRCAIPTLQHGTLPTEPGLTRDIATVNRVQFMDKGMLACLGAYATVRTPGAIAIGDAVHFQAASAQA